MLRAWTCGVCAQTELEGKDYRPIVDPAYNWKAWAAPKTADGKLDHNAALTGADLIDFVNGKFFPYLKHFRERTDNPDSLDYKIGEIFSEIGNKFRSGYAYAKIYGGLERRKIAAVIPAKAEPIRSPVPMRRFRYDAKHDILKCPRGKKLKAGRAIKHGRFFTSRARDCRGCDLARLCLSKGRVNKAVVLGNDYPALLRARRRRERWSEEDRDLYQRHRWRSEGYHGEAKTWHGLARAVRRGLQNMRIQAFLTAAAVNLKRLAAALCSALARILSIAAGWARSTAPMNANGENQPDVQEREPAMAA